ncbi:MAG: glutathione S-transferase N-terminal domain-containing protein [Solirubrobacterales bacterium]|nr:glutathione S-transferase N-terminal domain-containing protein [Solirubrobacterales bacterium]
MPARLFTIPSSHPSWSARLMLEHKGIPYKRVDLVAVISKPILRAAGFPGVTVPALRIDGKRVQGTGAIARELDRLVPDPPLFPAEAELRQRVEAAERWGDETLQPVPRRIVWNLLGRDRSGLRSYLEGARLGVPTSVAAATSAPIVAMAARFHRADDVTVHADLRALPGLIDHVDALIAAGVIGGDETNAADFQIATSVALLLTMDDLKPLIAGRPAENLARRIAPAFPGHAAPTLPADWLEPVIPAQ